MNQKSEEILSEMRTTCERARFASSVGASHGLIFAFSTIILHEEFGRSYNDCAAIVEQLVISATEDVPRDPNWVTELGTEAFVPEYRCTHEAFTRHTGTFLQLLVKLIEDGLSDPSAIDAFMLTTAVSGTKISAEEMLARYGGSQAGQPPK